MNSPRFLLLVAAHCCFATLFIQYFTRSGRHPPQGLQRRSAIAMMISGGRLGDRGYGPGPENGRQGVLFLRIKRLRNVVFPPLFPPSLPPSPSSPPLPSSSLPPLFFPSLPFPFPSFPTPLKSKLYNYMPPLYFKSRAKSRVKTPPFPSFFSPPFFPPFPYAAFYNYFGASKDTGRSQGVTFSAIPPGGTLKKPL